MNSKSNNPKGNTANNGFESAPPSNDMIHGPKTPIKRYNMEQANIYSKLSPLHLAPKIEARLIEPPFNAHHEMRYVETPVPK